jgi:ankyrin repeat protein
MRIPAIQSAAGRGELGIVRLLLDYGADVNAPGIFESTAMNFAARQGHAEVVRLLIERGAAVNPHANSRSYPLENAKFSLRSLRKEPVGHLQTERALLNTIAALEQAGAREGPWWPPQKPSWWFISWWPF